MGGWQGSHGSCDLLTGVARPRVKGQESYHGNTGLVLLLIETATNSVCGSSQYCSIVSFARLIIRVGNLFSF